MSDAHILPMLARADAWEHRSEAHGLVIMQILGPQAWVF